MRHVVNVHTCTTSGLYIRQEHEHQSACSRRDYSVFRGAASAVQHHAERRGTTLQPMAGTSWPSQPTPYAGGFMAPPAWPTYMPSYMPWPTAQQALMQAEFEELVRQHHDLEARELKVQCMTRTRNLNAVRDARVTTALPS